MKRSRATRFGRAGILLPVLLATACAAIPDLGPKPVPRAASDYRSERSLDGARSAWPADGWWRQYGDRQLDGLIDEGLAGSPGLAAAAARVRQAQGLTQQAGAALLPRVDASAQVTDQNQSQNIAGPGAHIPTGWHDTALAAGSFSLDLDLFGKNRAALRAAKKEAAAAQFEAEETRLLLTTNIASAYADLAALHAQRDSLQAALDIRGQTLKLVQHRYDAGLDTRDALKQAEARIPQTRADLAATDEAIELDNHALAALIGEGPDRALSITRPTLVKLHAQGIPEAASIDLIGRRPDIAAARMRVEAAGEHIKEARADFFPNINISALAGLQSLGLGGFLSHGSQFASVSPAVTLPLFHGGALQGQYRGRRGQYDEAVADYDGQVVEALHETADAVTSQKMLADRLAQSRDALAAYEEAARVARSRYEHGLSPYLNVLTAEESVINARLAVARLETRAFTIDVQLVRALGGGFRAA